MNASRWWFLYALLSLGTVCYVQCNQEKHQIPILESAEPDFYQKRLDNLYLVSSLQPAFETRKPFHVVILNPTNHLGCSVEKLHQVRDSAMKTAIPVYYLFLADSMDENVLTVQSIIGCDSSQIKLVPRAFADRKGLSFPEITRAAHDGEKFSSNVYLFNGQMEKDTIAIGGGFPL